jgi:methionyl-tRNA formyltransferase
MSDPKVIFAGTPDFALRCLEALVDLGRVPVAVLTQPDRPAGRGRRLTESPVKRYAKTRQIRIIQPRSLRAADVQDGLKALQPDIMIVAAYGLLLPQSVLDIPRRGCLNVHASLLPRWRGAAPIQAAILAGDTRTGVSLMAMTAGLDCGPVYIRESVSIGVDETAGQLHDRLATLGCELLERNLDSILDGKLSAEEQDETLATYAHKIRRDDAALDWQRSAIELERCIRAYNPAPGAYFDLDGIAIKCWQAAVSGSVDAPPGTVVAAGAEGIVVSCGDGSLKLESLQRPGKRAVTAREFAAQVDLTGRRLR